MDINFTRLLEILHTKTNSAIEKLNEFKCTSQDYKTTLEAIVNNLEHINIVKKLDTSCENCKKNNKNENITKNPSLSPIGKQWISFKGEK
jgi:hypothetical protein